MSKRKVAIVTDSVANLMPETIAEHNIYVIPQILNWEGQSLLDQIDISTAQFYERLPQSKDCLLYTSLWCGEVLDNWQDDAVLRMSDMAVDFELTYKEQLQEEINSTPGEYLPALLQIVRLYRQSVVLKPASDSFRQGWQEVMSEQTLPLSELWRDLNAD